MPAEGGVMTTRPPIIIPPALKPLAELKRWLIWRFETTATGKRTKVPYQGRAPRKHADTTDPSTWCDLKPAMLAYIEERADGIGFVLTDNPISAVDLDDCRDAETGEIHPWARDKIERAGTYVEVTPSEQGLRIIGMAPKGEPLHERYQVPNANGVGCEIYRRAERYITVTGRQIGTASELADIDGFLDALHVELSPESAGTGARASRKHARSDSRSATLNENALANLGGWVPQLFPTAKRTRKGGYRITSADLGRGFEEDLSITPQGAKWFGIADQGDARQGRRTPIELVCEWQHVEPPQAAEWLEKTLASKSNGAATPEPPKPEPPAEEVTDADVEITRLAKLTALQYELERKGAAKKLGISRVNTLDDLVGNERRRLNPDDDKQGQGQPIEFPEPEPWPDPVSGDALLTETADTIRAHVVMPERERDICALWAVYTHLVDCFLVAPRLAIRSPTPECGKTTLLSVLEHLVPKPLRTSSVTASVTFRVIAMCQPTLLIDEAKNIADKTDLLEVLNDGHHRGGRTLRNVPMGDGYEPRAFATFAALAIALIGSLPPELHGRSVVIDLKRRLPGDVIEEIRVGRTDHLDVLARKAARWTADNAARIANMDPVMPLGIYSRAADNWKPLLAIADAAGGEWPQRARDTAIKSHAAADVDDVSMVELLLSDIRDAFASEGKASVVDMFAEKVDVEISSADLVKALVAIEGRPWAEMGKSRKPLTQNRLARMFKPLKITPGKIGPKEARLAGYKLTQFEDAFSRYLPVEGCSNRTTGHRAANTGTSDIFKPDTANPGCPVAKCEKPNNDGLVSGCPVAKGVVGETTPVRTPKARSDDLPYTGDPVAVPDLPPDPLDDHGTVVAAREPEPRTPEWRERLAGWCDRWLAEGEPPEDMADALRFTIREEIDDPSQVEVEFEKVMRLVRRR
jgi:Protein of unknown function (DUF3631)